MKLDNTNSIDLLKDPLFRKSVTAYSIRYHRADDRGPHFDFALGNPDGKVCIDFVTQRKVTEQQIKTMTPNLPAAGDKQVIAFMEPHDVSFLLSPIRKVHVIPAGEYGAGKWMVVKAGKASITPHGTGFVIRLDADSYLIREASFSAKGKTIKKWLIQLMKTNESSGSDGWVKKQIAIAKQEARGGYWGSATHQVEPSEYYVINGEFKDGGQFYIGVRYGEAKDVFEVVPSKAFSTGNISVDPSAIYNPDPKLKDPPVIEYMKAKNLDEALDKAIVAYHLKPLALKRNRIVPGKHATVRKDTGTKANVFETKYKMVVNKNQAKMMRVKVTDAFLADLEKIAKTEHVEWSGGLDFEKGQKGITGYKKVRGTHWSSPFFKRNDYEMQFHTHVAYKHDDNRASSHPSPADMCNVSLLYPGFVLWENTKGKVQWLLLRSVSTSWQTENRMESLYNEVEDVIGGNTEPGFDRAWRSALNKKGLDFEKVVPNETLVYLERDSSDKQIGTKKSNQLKKPTTPMVREKEKRPFAWFVAAQGKKSIIWYEFKRTKAKSEVIGMLSGDYIGGLGEVYILDEGSNKYYQFEVYNNKQIDGKPIKEVVMVKKYPLGDPDALELPRITHGQELHVFVFEYFDEGRRFTKELMISAINYTAAKSVVEEKIPRWLANRGLPKTGWKIVSHRVF